MFKVLDELKESYIDTYIDFEQNIYHQRQKSHAIRVQGLNNF